MKKMNLYLLGIFVSLFVWSGISSATANAAEDTAGSAESILLTPTSKRYELDAGSSKTDALKVVNNGSSRLSFIVYARPYGVEGEVYKSNYDSEAKNADAYKWVQFDQASFELEPGQSTDITYTIRVPKNATPGGHYGVLFAETQVSGDVNGTTIAQKKRIGAIMYAQVNGNVSTSGQFIGSSVPLFQYRAPLQIAQRVKNSGNMDFTVKDSVRVYDVFGGLKYKYDKDAVIFPATTRSIVNDWQNPAWIGVYRVEQKAVFLDTSKTSSNYVILVPVWVYLTVIGLIGARVLYAFVLRKRRK